MCIEGYSGDVRDPAHHCRPNAKGAEIAVNPDGFDEQTRAAAAGHSRYASELHGSNNLSPGRSRGAVRWRGQ